jgi:hypothetical protein
MLPVMTAIQISKVSCQGSYQLKTDCEGVHRMQTISSKPFSRPNSTKFGLLFAAMLLGIPLVSESVSASRANNVPVNHTQRTTSTALALQNSLSLGPKGAKGDTFGTSVAFSRDGHVAIIGVPSRVIHGQVKAGAAYVTRLEHGVWRKLSELSLGGKAGTWDHFGAAVALNKTGTTAVIGAPIRAPMGGAVEVFRFVGGKWRSPTELSEGGGNLGQSVAVSDDGNVVLAGAPNLTVGHGMAGAGEVFRFTGGKWSKPTQLDLGTRAGDNNLLGSSAALSSKGSTAILGAPDRMLYGHHLAGAAEIFDFKGGRWTGPSELHVAADIQDADLLGSSVAISANGRIALAGAPNRVRRGAVEVFRFETGGWRQSQTLTLGSIAADFDGFGTSVASSTDSSVVAVGVPLRTVNGKSQAGAMAAFTFGGGKWSTPTLFSLGSKARQHNSLGSSVALTGDGHRLLGGAPNRTVNGHGAAGTAELFAPV